MKFTDRVKIAFTGTPEAINRWILSENIEVAGVPLFIIGDCGSDLYDDIVASTNQGISFSNLINAVTPMASISGVYGRGIEILDEDGDSISLIGADATFHVVNLLDLFGEAEPVPLAAEKVVEVPLPDVAEISTDELIKVVSNYDRIHEAAKLELVKRLEPIAEKAKISLDSGNENK